MYVNGLGVWHLGLLAVFALVVLGVVVLVVALVTSASRQPPGGSGRAPAGYAGQAGYPSPTDPAQHPGYSLPPAYPGADPMGGPAGSAPGYAAAPSTGTGASAGRRSVEQRLADLEDLHRRGVVNADEYAAARIRILGEL